MAEEPLLTKNEAQAFGNFKDMLEEISRDISVYSESNKYNARLRDPEVNEYCGPITNSTFEVLYHMVYHFNRFRESSHPLSVQANGIIYNIMDIMFSGRRRYDKDFDEYDALDFIGEYETMLSLTHFAGVSDGTVSYDFELNLEKFKANWLEVSDTCIPALTKIAYEMNSYSQLHKQQCINRDLSDPNNTECEVLPENIPDGYWTPNQCLPYLLNQKAFEDKNDYDPQDRNSILTKLARAAGAGKIEKVLYKNMSKTGTKPCYEQKSVKAWGANHIPQKQNKRCKMFLRR